MTFRLQTGSCKMVYCVDDKNAKVFVWKWRPNHYGSGMKEFCNLNDNLDLDYRVKTSDFIFLKVQR